MPVPVAVQPDGSFEIPNIPPGSHVLDVVGPDGMSGGRVEFEIVAGSNEVLPPIEPAPCGQIAGMVMKFEDGALTPLAGVEVIARSDLIWIMTDENAATIAPASEPNDAPLIYPPPEGATYTAHTDDDGSYVMKAVRPGPYFVTVAVPGLETGEVFVSVGPGRTAAADFVLKPVVDPGVGRIEGTVVSANSTGATAPIEGALVEVVMDNGWAPPPPGPIPVPIGVSFPGVGSSPGSESGGAPGGTVSPPDIIWRAFSTLTDSDGRYSLNVPSGHCLVSAWLWGYHRESRRATVQPGETIVVDFALKPAPMPLPVPLPEPL